MEIQHTTDVMPTVEKSFEQFIRRRVSTVVVRDSQLEKRDRHARAQLRSLPLFQAFGYETVIHTDLWDNDFKLVDYEHIGAESAAAEDLEFPLVHVATQDGIDEYGEEELVRGLIERSTREDGRYVLVTDTTAPRTPTYTKKPGKSIVDEFDVTVQDYVTLANMFLEEHLDSALPVTTTRNLYLHAVSTVHKRQGAPASTLEGLFDYTRAPADSPVWAPLYYFIRHDLDQILEDYSERIREALRSWTERGETQRIANNMLDALHICEYKEAELDAYRNRDPELR